MFCEKLIEQKFLTSSFIRLMSRYAFYFLLVSSHTTVVLRMAELLVYSNSIQTIALRGQTSMLLASSGHVPRRTPVPLKMPAWESAQQGQDNLLFVPARTRPLNSFLKAGMLESLPLIINPFFCPLRCKSIAPVSSRTRELSL